MLQHQRSSFRAPLRAGRARRPGIRRPHPARDPLTGLLGAQAFLVVGQRVLLQARRGEEPVGLLCLALGPAGVACGDGPATPRRGGVEELLVGVGRRMRQVLRGEDLVARTGWAELAALLPGSGPDETERVLTELLGWVPPDRPGRPGRAGGAAHARAGWTVAGGPGAWPSQGQGELAGLLELVRARAC